MRLIVIKVHQDVVNGGVNSIVVGVFEDGQSQPTVQIPIPKYNLVRDKGEIKVGQEVKIIPVAK